MSLKNTKAQFVAVIPAAGVGKRMQSTQPKQYLQLSDLTVLEQTILRVLSHPRISQVIVAIGPEDEYFEKLPIANNPDVISVIGGKERSDSVLAGLRAVDENTFDWVLVHDAARPCLTHQDIDKLISFCTKENAGAVLATPVRDTMKRSDCLGSILATEDRELLWHANTPQMYPLKQLTQALMLAQQNNVPITDESSAIEWFGKPSFVVAGRDDNIKITRPNDLKLAAFYLQEQLKEKQ